MERRQQIRLSAVLLLQNQKGPHVKETVSWEHAGKMSLFVLDTAGDKELLFKKPQNVGQYVKAPTRALLDIDPKKLLLEATCADDGEDIDDDEDLYGLPPLSVDLSKIISETLVITERKPTKAEEEMERAAEALVVALKNQEKHWRTNKKRGRLVDLDFSDFNKRTRTFESDEKLVRTDVAKQMAQSQVKPGAEQFKELPNLTKKKQCKLNREERSKTKGAGWFNLPATELTEEVENDLKLLQMRSVLNPKHFYKKNDLKVLPKYFQIGTVQHSPLDHYSERGTRHKKRSLVDELLADSKAQTYTKRKYKEIVAQKSKYAHRKAMQKMKKLKKTNS